MAHRWDPNMYYPFGCVDLGVIAMKSYSRFPKTPELDPHYSMRLNVMPWTLNGFTYCYLTLIILIATNRPKDLLINENKCIKRKKNEKLANRFRSSFNRAKSKIIFFLNYRKYVGWREKNCIGDYIEIILSHCRHCLCLKIDGLPDKI